MDNRYKQCKDVSNQIGALIGDKMSQNSHVATSEIIEGMRLFEKKMTSISNVGYDQAKGNLFEYIEAAKFNKNAALKGSGARAVVTDAVGRPHDPADILITKDGKVVREVQAKFVSPSRNNPGEIDRSAAQTVFDQAGGQRGHWGKYRDMDKLIRKDESYNEKGSLLDETKRLAKKRAESEGIHADDYRDVYETLTDELRYKKDGITSGGTTSEEVMDAFDNPKKYVRTMERQQMLRDVGETTSNMAAASAISNAMTSGVRNLFQLYKDEKTLEEAIRDVGAETIKGTARGAGTGFLSSLIRIGSTKSNIPVLTDSAAATVMAGGIIDGGVAIYQYAVGEIDTEQLQSELLDTVVKSSTTIYFTKAVNFVVGSANPFLPMAIYTAASYVTTCTREIIENANLKRDEYDRMRALLEQSTMLMHQYHLELNEHMRIYESKERTQMVQLLDAFEYNLENGLNYDAAIYAIVNYANQTGIALQHAKFDDFKTAMKSSDSFILK